MARTKKKESEPRTFRIKKEIAVRLDAYSESSMIPRTAIVERSLEEYLEKVETKEK